MVENNMHSDPNHTPNGRRKFLKTVSVGSAVALSGLAGCVGGIGSGNSGTITYGQPAASTGKWSNIQPPANKATDLAVKEINDTGGTAGMEVEIKRSDTAVDPSQARTVVQQLVNNEDAKALLGLYSSEIAPLFDFLVGMETPIVTPWPGSTYLDTRGGDMKTPENLDDDQWIWRTTIGDSVHTIGAARYMIDEGYKKMGLLYGSSQGAASWVKAFKKAVRV